MQNTLAECVPLCYTKTNVTIDNNIYNVYQYPNNKDYVLVYGIDLETGTKDWYLYNVKEKSIQVYMSDIIDNMKDDFNERLEEYKLVLLGMVGLSLLLLLIVIIQIVSKNKMKKKLLKRIQVQIQKENTDIKKKDENKVIKEDEVKEEKTNKNKKIK